MSRSYRFYLVNPNSLLLLLFLVFEQVDSVPEVAVCLLEACHDCVGEVEVDGLIGIRVVWRPYGWRCGRAVNNEIAPIL